MLHTTPGNSMLNICSGVGSDMLGGFFAGLHVVGVEVDVNQCKLAAKRFDDNLDPSNREVLQPHIPLSRITDFYSRQKELIIDIVQAQRDKAVSDYTDYRLSLQEDSENVQSAEAVIAEEGPELMTQQYAAAHFSYNNIKSCVEEHLLPVVPAGTMFDALIPPDYLSQLRKSKKASSSLSSSNSSASALVVKFNPPCQTCGDDVLPEHLGTCTGCDAALHKSGSTPACFVMVDKQMRCRADCVPK